MRVAILIFVISAFCLSESVSASAADSLFSLANKAFEEGRYHDASTMYRQVERAGSRSPQLDFNLGLTLAHLGQDGEALYFLTRAQRDPVTRTVAHQPVHMVRERLMLPAPHEDASGLPIAPIWLWIAGSVLAVAGAVLYALLAHQRTTALVLITGGLILTLAAPLMSALDAADREAMVIRGPAVVFEEYDSLIPTSGAIRSGQTVYVHELRGARLFVKTMDGRSGWIDRHRVRKF